MFRSKINARYLFKAEQLFQAIDKMALNTDEHILLNFGIDIWVVNQFLKNPALTPQHYNGLSIITVAHQDRNLIRSSLLVLKKSDLPRFEYRDLEPETIQKFGLTPINPAINLYAAVIDLNAQPQFKELFKNENEEILNQSVYLKLNMQLEVRWLNVLKIIELQLYSDFFQKGIVNHLDEVSHFN
jgi:hypothetical protein